MSIPRVVFLSAPPLGETMLAWLKTQPCEIVVGEPWDLGLLPGHSYDLGLNFLGTRKIPPEELAKTSWINTHPAPLPEYGGRNVAYQAIINGAKEYGATIHYMAETFDTGPIIECYRFPISEEDTAGSIFERSVKCCRYLFEKWVPELLKGVVPSTPQEGKTRYFKKRDIDDHAFYLTESQQRIVRALTFAPKHYAKVQVGGKWYRLVPEEFADEAR